MLTIPHRIRTEPFSILESHVSRLANLAPAVTIPQMALRRDIVGPTYEGQAMIPQVELINGVAVIQVSGVLMNSVNFWDFYCGGCFDYQWLTDMHAQAVALSPRAIAIIWDSPGGSVVGGTEARDQLLSAPSIPLVHFTKGCLASMALRLALTGETFATSTAIVGSVGTIAVYHDSSTAAKQVGVDVLVFTSNGAGESSPLKGTGTPGAPISQDQRDFIQNRVHESAAIFRSEVLAARPGATGDSMRGGWVYGSQALTDNLITGIVPNFETLLMAI